MIAGRSEQGRRERQSEAAMFTSDDDGQICMNVIIIARKGTMKLGQSERQSCGAKQERSRPPPPGAIANITEYLTGFGSEDVEQLGKHSVARKEALYR